MWHSVVQRGGWYSNPKKWKEGSEHCRKTGEGLLSQDVPEEPVTYGDKKLAMAQPDHCQGTKNKLAGVPRATPDENYEEEI